MATLPVNSKPTPCPVCDKPVVALGTIGYHWAPNGAVCPASGLPPRVVESTWAPSGAGNAALH